MYIKSYHLIYLLPYVTFQVNISGLRAATDTNRQTGRRLVWVFLLIVCFAVMVAQITDRVRHFLSEPVSVQVSVARNNSLLYPAVTVCNKVSYTILKVLRNADCRFGELGENCIEFVRKFKDQHCILTPHLNAPHLNFVSN